MQQILTLSRSSNVVDTLKLTVGDRFEVNVSLTLEDCIDRFRAVRHEITFLDLNFLVPDGFTATTSVAKFKSIFQPFREIYTTAPLVVISSQDQLRNLIQAVKGGANHYLIDPIDPQALLHMIEDLDRHTLIQSELELLRHNMWDDDKAGVSKTNSPAMVDMFAQAHSVAETDSSVLLLGETGVGKGVLAKLIHRIVLGGMDLLFMFTVEPFPIT